MNIKAVIFDLDGTLIDSMQIWRKVDMDFLGKRGISVPEDLFSYLPQGNSFIQTAQYFKDRFKLRDTVEEIMSEWTQMVHYHYTHTINLKDGALDLINYLVEKKIQIALGTSNSYELAQIVLTANNVFHLFNSIVTGCMELRGKPYPDIYLKNAENMNIQPKHCIVIEDTLSGVTAGKNAGMTVFAIYDEDSISEQDSIKNIADRYFFEFSAITAFIKEFE